MRYERYDVINVKCGVPDFENPIATFATAQEAEDFADMFVRKYSVKEIGINAVTLK